MRAKVGTSINGEKQRSVKCLILCVVLIVLGTSKSTPFGDLCKIWVRKKVVIGVTKWTGKKGEIVGM
jgi:hypothetical protein